jgi:hypothetical protein
LSINEYANSRRRFGVPFRATESAALLYNNRKLTSLGFGRLDGCNIKMGTGRVWRLHLGTNIVAHHPGCSEDHDVTYACPINWEAGGSLWHISFSALDVSADSGK